jgi:hypothetical protein
LFCALCPVLALRTTVIVATRFSRPKASSRRHCSVPSSVSSISAKSAPSSARRGLIKARRSRIIARHASGVRASS